MSKRTPVSVLEIFCMKRNVPQPKYNVSCEGNSIFTINVKACQITKTATGEGLKETKHAAAQKVLTVLKEFSDLRHEIMNIEEELVDFTGALLADCVKRHLPSPVFTFHNRDHWRTARCSVENFQTEASTSTRQRAKELAAKAMLEHLAKYHKVPVDPPHYQKHKFFLAVEPDRVEVAKKLLDNPREADADKQLREVCKALNFPSRKFNVDAKDGPMEIIELICNVRYVYEGERNKASSEILVVLKNLLQAY